MKNKRFIIYADLNCPFCFALHERLLDLEHMHQVVWRSIEHAPSVRFETHNLHVQTELINEVNRVREVASEINILVPPGRPNSRLATHMVAEAFRIDPEKAIDFRTAIYRSLWVEGKDFSDPQLLEVLRVQVGLPELGTSAETQNKLATWQNEWETGDFARNIPALVTGDGNKILGLPAPEIIEAFLSGDDEQVFNEGEFCYLKPREKVLIASDYDGDLESLTTSLEQEYQIEYSRFGSAVYDACVSDNPPDLVIMDTTLAEPDGFETCTMIKDNELSHNIPVIMFSRQQATSIEVRAFDAGAADYLTMPYAHEVLRARVRVLMRLKRTTDLLEQFSKLDSLTEIPNRREFSRLFEKEWHRAKRNHTPLSLILLDVDYFKKYNDNYGHMEGDECLKKVAQTIERSIRRPHDIVARFGGEEFVILLPETNEAGAREVAQKLKENLVKANLKHEFSDVSQLVTVSQGISTIIPGPLFQPKNIIDAADVALYAAKKAGRNTMMFNDLQA